MHSTSDECVGRGRAIWMAQTEKAVRAPSCLEIVHSMQRWRCIITGIVLLDRSRFLSLFAGGQGFMVKSSQPGEVLRFATQGSL
jgi:hypothetical protein